MRSRNKEKLPWTCSCSSECFILVSISNYWIIARYSPSPPTYPEFWDVQYMFSSCTKASSSNTVKSKALRIPRKTRSHCVFSNILAATRIVLKWGGLTYCKPLLIVGFSLNGVRSSSLLCLKGLHFLQVWIQLPDRRNFCSSQEV